MSYRLPNYQKEVLEKGGSKPVILIHGNEEFLIRNFLSSLRSIAGENLITLWGDEITTEDILSNLSEGDMFAGTQERVVVVRSFEEFVAKQLKRKASQKSFLDTLKRVKRSKLVLVVSYRLTSQDLGREPYKTISAVGDVVISDRLPAKKVKELVKRKLEREAGGIEDSALDLLVEMCGGNLQVLRQETDKLIDYSEGRKITEEDVKKVCIFTGEQGIFEFIDALLGKEGEKAILSLGDLIRAGHHPLQILATVSSYGVKIYTIKHLLRSGVNMEKAFNLSGVKHRYAQMKYKTYIENLSDKDVKHLIESLYRIDMEVKVRFEDPQRSLENFVKDFTLS